MGLNHLSNSILFSYTCFLTNYFLNFQAIYRLHQMQHLQIYKSWFFLLQNLLFISICSKRNFQLYINNKTKKIKEIKIRIFKIRCSIWWTRKIIVFLKYSVNTKEEKNYNAPRGNISTHFTTLCYSVCCWINSKAMTLTFR